MNATGRTITMLTALTLLVAATAVPAAAAVTGHAETGAETPTDGVGPPSDLPGPVPGFVEEILWSVGEFLSGLTPGELATDRPAVAQEG
ncbi:MAG: hypothetical protein V5A16_00710 [Haloplanus sp.]